jgi:hypothetical protein
MGLEAASAKEFKFERGKIIEREGPPRRLAKLLAPGKALQSQAPGWNAGSA